MTVGSSWRRPAPLITPFDHAVITVGDLDRAVEVHDPEKAVDCGPDGRALSWRVLVPVDILWRLLLVEQS